MDQLDPELYEVLEHDARLISLARLMTSGAPLDQPPNPDFQRALRRQLIDTANQLAQRRAHGSWLARILRPRLLA